MANVTWGGTSGHLQVGIEVTTDGYDTNTPSINVYVDVWVRSIGWGYQRNMVAYLRGSVAADYGFFMSSPTGGTVEHHVGRYRIPDQGQSYGGGPGYSFSISLSGTGDGSNPTLAVNWSLPARPPNTPLAPGVAARDITSNGVSMVVTSVPDGRGSPINAYQVRVQLPNETLIYDQITSGSVRVNGLTRATVYQGFIRAGNGVGWGAWAGLAFTTLTTAPSAPTNIRLADGQSPGPTSIPLMWNAPADSGGAPVTSYQLNLATSDDFQQNPVVVTVTPAQAAGVVTPDGLVPGMTYRFRVRATNAAGTSVWSNIGTAETLAKNLVKVAANDWRPVRLWIKRPSGWVQARLWKKHPNGTWVQ